MAGGGNLGAAATNVGPSLSGNMGAGMGGMGFGNVGSALGGQSGAGGPQGQNFGPLDQQSIQNLNNISGLMGAQQPQTSPPPPANNTPPPMAAIGDYYQNILGRKADDNGLAYWTNAAQNGMSMDAIKQSFLNSDEYKNSPTAQQGYAKYLSSLSAPQPAAQPAPQAAPKPYVPTTTTWSAQQRGPVFNNNPLVTQSGGEGSGGAMNFQYNRGGIASLIRR